MQCRHFFYCSIYTVDRGVASNKQLPTATTLPQLSNSHYNAFEVSKQRHDGALNEASRLVLSQLLNCLLVYVHVRGQGFISIYTGEYAKQSTTVLETLSSGGGCNATRAACVGVVINSFDLYRQRTRHANSYLLINAVSERDWPILFYRLAESVDRLDQQPSATSTLSSHPFLTLPPRSPGTQLRPQPEFATKDTK